MVAIIFSPTVNCATLLPQKWSFEFFLSLFQPKYAELAIGNNISTSKTLKNEIITLKSYSKQDSIAPHNIILLEN